MKGTLVVASAACLLTLGVASLSFASGTARCTGAQDARGVHTTAARRGSVGVTLASAPGLRNGRRVALAPQAAEGGTPGVVRCEGCESWSVCQSGLGGVGASTQVVPLKNGVMYVYTAESPAGVRALQAIVAQHHDRLQALTGAARLCPDCRALRTASRRGRLSLEVLNIDGGCIMVTTSSDPAVIAKIYAAAGVSGTPRVKG